MLRWLRRALAVLSFLPLVVLATAWLLTRTSSYAIARADEEGNAVILYLHANRLTFIRATGWPRAQPLTWESAPPINDPAVSFPPIMRGGPVLGTWWGTGWAELRIPIDAGDDDAGTRFFVPLGTGSFLTAATGQARGVATTYAAPFVAAIMPLAWLPPWAFRAARRRQRRRAGRCLSCGYDVRASTERCPECGALLLSPVFRGEAG